MYEPDAEDRRARAKAWFTLGEARHAGVEVRKDQGRQVFSVFYPHSMSVVMRDRFEAAFSENWPAILQILTHEQDRQQ